MTHIETITGEQWAADISVDRNGVFTVAFGYIDSDGFNCVKPSRDYKSENAARRAAAKWANH